MVSKNIILMFLLGFIGNYGAVEEGKVHEHQLYSDLSEVEKFLIIEKRVVLQILKSFDKMYDRYQKDPFYEDSAAEFDVDVEYALDQYTNIKKFRNILAEAKIRASFLKSLSKDSFSLTDLYVVAEVQFLALRSSFNFWHCTVFATYYKNEGLNENCQFIRDYLHTFGTYNVHELSKRINFLLKNIIDPTAYDDFAEIILKLGYELDELYKNTNWNQKFFSELSQNDDEHLEEEEFLRILLTQNGKPKVEAIQLKIRRLEKQFQIINSGIGNGKLKNMDIYLSPEKPTAPYKSIIRLWYQAEVLKVFVSTTDVTLLKPSLEMSVDDSKTYYMYRSTTATIIREIETRKLELLLGMEPEGRLKTGFSGSFLQIIPNVDTALWQPNIAVRFNLRTQKELDERITYSDLGQFKFEFREDPEKYTSSLNNKLQDNVWST